MKEFLAIRDREQVFDGPREAGGIGIPCLVGEDGTVSLSWEQYL
jgi:glutaredoxin-related protein